VVCLSGKVGIHMEEPTRHIGRKAGVPNKRTLELAEKLEALGSDPLKALVTIAADSKCPLDLEVSINKELLAYIFPKRKALDVASDGPPLVIQFGAKDALL